MGDNHTAPGRATHYFTKEFPDADYPPTTASSHAQTALWPAYLPVSDERLFIFERSKNAQLVVYTANFRDRARRELDAKWPMDINWQSFGWTAQPTSNATGMLERRMAWGYSHKRLDALEPEAAITGGVTDPRFQVTLNALPSRVAQLYVDAKGRLVLQTCIGGEPSRLWKVYVKTGASRAFIPKVLYVELYGTHLHEGHATYERIVVSS